MKKVFTDKSDVAHLWANQLQDEARTSGNFYFNGPTIYSYGRHFPIAKHVEHKGQKAVLFTTRSYSNTTSKHISVVRMACNHKNVIYCHNPEASHTENFEQWRRNIEIIAPALANARKPEKYLDQIAREYAQAVRYAEFFGVKIPADLKKAGVITDTNKLIAYQKAKKAREYKALKVRHEKALKDWREFEVSRMYNRIGEDYLRYNSLKDRIETSQGIEIPVAVGKVFYKNIKTIVANGGCTDCNIKLLQYNVTEISAKGIVVGCHNISMKEIQRIATLLNW